MCGKLSMVSLSEKKGGSTAPPLATGLWESWIVLPLRSVVSSTMSLLLRTPLDVTEQQLQTCKSLRTGSTWPDCPSTMRWLSSGQSPHPTNDSFDRKAYTGVLRLSFSWTWSDPMANMGRMVNCMGVPLCKRLPCRSWYEAKRRVPPMCAKPATPNSRPHRQEATSLWSVQVQDLMLSVQ